MSTQSFNLKRNGPTPGRLLVLVLVLLLGVPPARSLAAGIDDGAGLFSDQAKQQATQQIQQIEHATGKTVAVVTVAGLGGQDIRALADQYRDQQQLDGVLVYIAPNERQLTVEVSASAADAVTPQEQTTIRDMILSQFSHGRYDAGLLAGLNAIGRDLQSGSAQSSGLPSPLSWPFLIFLGVAGALALTLLLLLGRTHRYAGQSGQSADLDPISGRSLPRRRAEPAGDPDTRDRDRSPVPPGDEDSARRV